MLDLGLISIASLGPRASTKFLIFAILGLLRVSEYSDIRGSEYKIEYEYSSLPKSLDRDFFFFLPLLLLKQEVFHKMVH